MLYPNSTGQKCTCEFLAVRNVFDFKRPCFPEILPLALHQALCRDMERERRIKFWISTIAKLVLVVWVLIKIVSYFSKEQTNDTSTTEKPAPKSQVDSPAEVKIEKEPAMVEPKERLKMAETEAHREIVAENPVASLEKVLKYRGKILHGAYFKIADCKGCTSTVTTKDGVARVTVPSQLIKDDKFHDFYVYAADTLVYHRAMRFSNLEFNTY